MKGARATWIVFTIVYLLALVAQIFFGNQNNFIASFLLLLFTPIISMIIPIFMQRDYSVKLEPGKKFMRTMAGIIPLVVIILVNYLAYNLTVVNLANKDIISIGVLALSLALYLAVFVILLPLRHSHGWKEGSNF